LTHTTNHEYMGDGTEDVEVGDASVLTNFSIDGEHRLHISSEGTQSLSNGLRDDSNGRALQNLTRGSHASSLTCLQTLASTIS